LIRLKIIAYFKGTDAEPRLDEIAGRLGLDRAALESLMHSERPLDNLTGLTLEEARRVLRQFEGLAVFEPELQKTIADFNETRRQIHQMEKLARDGGSTSGK
jgi:hypothetical protein